jgi:hypothetical protein
MAPLLLWSPHAQAPRTFGSRGVDPGGNAGLVGLLALALVPMV